MECVRYMKMKRILIPGGTGAMGIYLVPELRRRGYAVDVVSLDERTSDDPGLRYFKANFLDPEIRSHFCAEHYDAIVDFMIYPGENFRDAMDTLLGNTEHYIFLSSYRVYNESCPITEDSPRLYDTSSDTAYLATDDYSLYKAKGENIISASGYRNYTIIRPAITFSRFRFQLVTLEAPVLIERMRAGKTVYLPETAKNIQATMTWAGDVAKMIAGLLWNDRAFMECFTVSTAEHNTWGTIAEYYRDFGGLRYEWIPQEDYMRLLSDGKQIFDCVKYQLLYDRLLNRVVDNRKILAVTGLRQDDFTTVYDGLATEYSRLPPEYHWWDTPVHKNMDEYTATRTV